MRPGPPPTSSSLRAPFDCHTGPERIQEDSAEFSALEKRVGTSHVCHHSTLRGDRPEPHRASSSRRSTTSLLPRLSKLPGFGGYYLIEAGDGVMSSIGFFDTSAQADESTRVAADWVREEKLETALPNAPKITGGEVVVHKTRELVRRNRSSRSARREGPHTRAFSSVPNVSARARRHRRPRASAVSSTAEPGPRTPASGAPATASRWRR